MSEPCPGCRCGCSPSDGDPRAAYDFTCERCGCGPDMPWPPTPAVPVGVQPASEAAEAALSGVIDDYDRLAGQVAAIRALCDEGDRLSGGANDAAHRLHSAIRAALVASSPTTPEGNQP